MPQDHAPQITDGYALWVWDLGLRRVVTATQEAAALWGATSEWELAARAFGAADPMTRLGEELQADLAPGTVKIIQAAPVAGRPQQRLRVDRARSRPRMLRFVLLPSERAATSGAPSMAAGSVFEASPAPLALLAPDGTVIRDNSAAAALFGPSASAQWSDRHTRPEEVEQAVATALKTGAAAYFGVFEESGETRRLSVTLTALEEGPAEPGDARARAALLATCGPLLYNEGDADFGPSGLLLIEHAPAAVALFSLETEALLYANARAHALPGDWRAPATSLGALFPQQTAELRGARSRLLLDETHAPQRVELGLAEALSTDATLCNWRGEAAFGLWITLGPGADKRNSAEAQSDSGPDGAPDPADDAASSARTNGAIRRLERAALIAQASHDMRTSANSARGFAELLRVEGPETGRWRERLQDIADSTDALIHRLEDLLERLTDSEK